MDIDAHKIALGLTTYVVLLLSLSVHESAHAWMALRMGDNTAQQQGRITLNFLKHIDPLGTVVIPLIQIFGPAGIRLFGWARPTPTQPANYRNMTRGEILVASAGPVSNFILAIIFTALLFVATRIGLGEELGKPVLSFLRMGVGMNVVLGVFNLIPIPPLDGSHVASAALPRELGAAYDRVMRPLGNVILILLLVTGALNYLLDPIIALVQGLLLGMVR